MSHLPFCGRQGLRNAWKLPRGDENRRFFLRGQRSDDMIGAA